MSLALALRQRGYRAVRGATNRVRKAWVAHSDRRMLEQLAASGPQAARLIGAFRQLDGSARHGHSGLRTIELERQRMSQDSAPLIDGSEPTPGLYDEGQTIAAATNVSKSPRSAHLLYQLIRAFAPRLVVELGTNVGISAAYQAMALSENGPEGRLVTLDASPYRLRLAKRLHATLGLGNVSYVRGLFAETLPSVLDEHPAVDFAYIDGHHQYQPTLDYFNLLWPHAAENAIFVFDDIRWSEGMLRAWHQLSADPRLRVLVDLGSMGIGFRSGGDSLVTPPICSVLHPDDPSAPVRFANRTRSA